MEKFIGSNFHFKVRYLVCRIGISGNCRMPGVLPDIEHDLPDLSDIPDIPPNAISGNAYDDIADMYMMV